MPRTYTVVLLRDEEEGGYVVWVPALGCYTQGEDIPESLRMAEEAIVAYLDGERELGKPAPSDTEAFNLELGTAREALVVRVKVPVEGEAIAA